MQNFPAIFARASVHIRDSLSDPVCTLTRKDGGGVVTMRGSFENDFLLQMATPDGLGIESRRPVFEYVTADYPYARQGDVLLAPNGLRYEVAGVEPNKNFTLLLLELLP